MNDLCRLVITSCPYNNELHSTNADLQCKSQIGLSKLSYISVSTMKETLNSPN